MAKLPVPLGVPVTADMFVVPMLVKFAPEPLKVVPVTVPVMLAPPFDTVRPELTMPLDTNVVATRLPPLSEREHHMTLMTMR